MSKWILIEVEDQIIACPDTYNTYEEAYAEMKRRYDSIVGEDDEARIENEYAYIQTDCYNADWLIYEVKM